MASIFAFTRQGSQVRTLYRPPFKSSDWILGPTSNRAFFLSETSFRWQYKVAMPRPPQVFMSRLDKEFPQWGNTRMLPFPEDYSPPSTRMLTSFPTSPSALSSGTASSCISSLLAKREVARCGGGLCGYALWKCEEHHRHFARHHVARGNGVEPHPFFRHKTARRGIVGPAASF